MTDEQPNVPPEEHSVVHESPTQSPDRSPVPAQFSTQEDLGLERIGDYPTLALCLDLWSAAQTGDRLPASIEITRLPDEVLDYTMLLDYLPAERDARVRTVGTYIGERAAFRAQGMTVRGFFEERDAAIVTRALHDVAVGRRPSLARRTFVPVAGEEMSYVRLILPLSANGKTVTGFFKTIEPSSLVSSVAGGERHEDSGR